MVHYNKAKVINPGLQLLWPVLFVILLWPFSKTVRFSLPLLHVNHNVCFCRVLYFDSSNKSKQCLCYKSKKAYIVRALQNGNGLNL